MTSVESTPAVEEGDTVDSVAEEEPQAESTDVSSVSWEPQTAHRLGSFATGSVLTFVGLSVAGVVLDHPAPAPGESVLDLLVVFGGLSALLFGLSVHSDMTETDGRSLRKRLAQSPLEWSRVRPVWIGSGAVAGGLLWAVGGFGVYLLPMAASFVPLFLQEWNITNTVDPEAGVVETSQPSYTRSRSLEWAVGVRRFDLPGWSLFVVSNRGKRWYEGVHFLSVPGALAPRVDTTLQWVVDKNEPPERIRRDERVITAAVGVSMLAVGPFLYLLSGEGALLLIAAGPSAIIAHGLLLHATRG
jgi:hypothetical protein